MMTLNEKNCLFCKGAVIAGFSISDRIGGVENASEIINQHFWFDINSTDFEYHYICNDCWQHVKAFHEFYRMVETVHNRHLVKNENPRSSDPNSEDFKSEDSISIPPNGMCYFKEKIIGSKMHSLYEGEYLIHSPKQSEFEIELVEPKFEEIHNDQEEIFDASTEDNQNPFDDDNAQQEPNVKRKRGRPKKLELDRRNSERKKKETSILREIEQIVCYMCNNQYKTFNSLKRHLLLHDAKQTFAFECELCERKFSFGSFLQRHMKHIHGACVKTKCNIETSCPICNIPLKQRSVKTHIATVHNPKTPLSCDQCGKVFYSQSHLGQHKLIHIDRRVQCKICDKWMKNQGSLKAHMVRTHETGPNKPYICDQCGKGFHCQSNLKQHKLTHLDRKLTEIQCDVCGKWLKNRTFLGVHRLMHDKKSEKCPHCDKIKVGKRALLSHIAVAHAQPKHPCTLCDKSFTRPLALKEHMAVHTGIPLYNCAYCTTNFKNNANMYKHMKAVHSEQWERDRANRAKKT